MPEKTSDDTKIAFAQFSPEYWMEIALGLARQAADNNEVPVGAIVVLNNKIIGEGCNSVIGEHDPTAHAEIQALRAAANRVGNYRLLNADMYVTLEPCAMCAGALVHSRIRHLYFGAIEPKSGAIISHINLLEQQSMNHQVTYTSQVLHEQCSTIISDFFARRRREKKALKKQLKANG